VLRERKRPVDEHRDHAVAGLVGEGIAFDGIGHLLRATHQYAQPLADFYLDQPVEPRADFILVFVAHEDKIAAGDIGADIGEPSLLADRLELFHRQLVVAADIHPAQQGYPTRHQPSASIAVAMPISRADSPPASWVVSVIATRL